MLTARPPPRPLLWGSCISAVSYGSFIMWAYFRVFQCHDSYPGLLGVRQLHFLCAMQPPKMVVLIPDEKITFCLVVKHLWFAKNAAGNYLRPAMPPGTDRAQRTVNSMHLIFFYQSPYSAFPNIIESGSDKVTNCLLSVKLFLIP